MTAVALWFTAAALPAQAQLAITEVMSEATIDYSNVNQSSRPDYWELTNFGTNTISLDRYGFNDKRKLTRLQTEPFANLTIRPGESIIFFRAETQFDPITTPEQFRAWWGGSNLPPNLQIRTYRDPGLDGDAEDELWVFDREQRVVDSVSFPRAVRVGRSFIYDPETGIWGARSFPGLAGAITAVQADDVGSPGFVPGTVPTRILQHPVSLERDAGTEATFRVVAAGMPRPKYRWLFNSHEILGATSDTLVLSNLAPANAGIYTVEVRGITGTFLSDEATLTVNSIPTPIEITAPPADVTAFVNQTATYEVHARGYPAPRYQWMIGNQEIPGATNSIFQVPVTTPEMSGTRYSVRVWNSLSTTNLTAALIVMTRPNLQFTEVMASPVRGDSSGHYDWFELTNFDTNTVDLTGFRISDTPLLSSAYTITNHLALRPMESVVFVEEMSRADFMEWWGPENLPLDAKIHTYHGFSLKNTGETLFLWNPASTDLTDTVDSLSWAWSNVGISLECTHDCTDHEIYGCIGECLTDSVPGQRGAFRRVESTDVASPCYITNPPPRMITVTIENGAAVLKCRGTEQTDYLLMASPTMVPGSWFILSRQRALTSFFEFVDPSPQGEYSRFYYLKEAP